MIGLLNKDDSWALESKLVSMFMYIAVSCVRIHCFSAVILTFFHGQPIGECTIFLNFAKFAHVRVILV